METIELIVFAFAALAVVVILLKTFSPVKTRGNEKMYDDGLRDYEFSPEEIEQQRLICRRIWFILYGLEDYPTKGLTDDEITDRYEGILLSLYTCRSDREHVRNFLRELQEKEGTLSEVDRLILDELRD